MCDERNEYFWLQYLIFIFFWVPVWYGCTVGHRKLAAELVRRKNTMTKDDFALDLRKSKDK